MDITQILETAESGDAAARAKLIEAAYNDLRQIAAKRMAAERQDHTLTTTALVHEVSIKMLNESSMPMQNRTQFFAYIARAMRNLLIDHARAKGSQKRGANRQRITFEEAIVASEAQSDDLIALNEALVGLGKVDERKAQVVEMRYFGGMTNEEVAASLGVSLATVKRDWNLAKGWLLQRLSDEPRNG